MNISAKDKSTGKANTITIKSSGGLTDSDIERMVNEAEAAREEDEKKKDLINIKNEADTMIYQTEKSISDNKDKVPQNVVDDVNAAISDLNEKITTDDTEAIKESLEELKTKSMEIGKAIYSQSQSEGGEAQEETEAQSETTEEEKKEEKKE